ncbi:MAG: GNAT family N-acetyltransferase [Oscillospiraceae bacterium]|nr:GNAT family N-acetyltransferase [Oscillospiraceae bacterium]
MFLGFNIRMVNKNDLPALQELYLNLHDAEIMPITSETMQLWDNILADPNYHILIGEEMGKVVSSVTLVIIKNLTREMRPHALIENMVTLPDYRNKGYARLLLEKSIEMAKENNCYRIMFISGSKNESNIRFYRNSGFTDTEKFAYIMKL